MLQVAAELLHHYPDGVFFVNLASVRSTEEVPTAVTGTIGLVGAATNTRERLADHLTGKRVLLVLDNFEQVIGSAPWVAQLLSSSTHLEILVTSRESLAVRGEREYAVPALSMPAPSTAAKIDAAGLRQYEAAQLLIDRAVAVKSDFEVTNASAPAVAEICMRLDGLPLAIELAAARLHVLSPEALLERLDSRLAVLRSRRRDVPARQQTLEAALDWSYELLDEEGRRLLHILPVFSGGFTVEAADEVYRRLHPATDTLSVFESLVAKNLVTERADGRFGLLAIIEEYALARVGEGNAEHETRRAHADWCLSLADDAERGMDTIAVDDWFLRLSAENPNIIATLEWLLEHDSPNGIRLAGLLGHYWPVTSHIGLGRTLQKAIDQTKGVPSAFRVLVALTLDIALLADGISTTDAASIEIVTEALRDAQRIGDHDLVQYATVRLFRLVSGRRSPAPTRSSA